MVRMIMHFLYSIIGVFLLIPSYINAQTLTWEILYGGQSITSSMGKVVIDNGNYIVEEGGDDFGPGGHQTIASFDSVGIHHLIGHEYPLIFSNTVARISDRSINGGFFICAEQTDTFGFDRLYLYNTSHSGVPKWKKLVADSIFNYYWVHDLIPTSDSGCLVLIQENIGIQPKLSLHKFNMYGDSLSTKIIQGNQFFGISRPFHSQSNRIYAIQNNALSSQVHDFKLVKFNEQGDTMNYFTLHPDSVVKYPTILEETPDHHLLLLSYELDSSSLCEYPVLHKVDTTGNFVWLKRLTHYQGFKIYDALTTPDGGFLFIGNHFTFPNVNKSNFNFFYKTDANADSVWMKLNFFGNNDLRIYHFAQTADGGYIAVGRAVYDELSYMVKTDSLGNFLHSILGQAEKLESQNQITIVPNPCKGYFSLSNNLPSENLHIKVHTINGNLILEKYLSRNESIDVTGLLNGFYFLKVDTENSSQTLKLCIQN